MSKWSSTLWKLAKRFMYPPDANVADQPSSVMGKVCEVLVLDELAPLSGGPFTASRLEQDSRLRIIKGSGLDTSSPYPKFSDTFKAKLRRLPQARFDLVIVVVDDNVSLGRVEALSPYMRSSRTIVVWGNSNLMEGRDEYVKLGVPANRLIRWDDLDETVKSLLWRLNI